MNDVYKNPKYYGIAFSFRDIAAGSLMLEVEDEGVKKVFRETVVGRQIYPQEFLLFVAARSDFEFVGWWNNWDLTQPLGETEKIIRPIILLRRV